MSGNIPGFQLDAKKLKAEVEKLHHAIQHGALERRRILSEKLGELTIAYTLEGKFDLALKTIEEHVELTETLVEEGQFEFRKELAMYLSNTISFIKPISRMHQIPCDLAPFFKHFSKCVESLAEDEFNEIKNEWALDIHQYAESLHDDNNATVAAIALLDRAIETLERRFNHRSSHFTDWHPLLTMYSSRGIWKFEVGDRESALADLLHYEELAEKAREAQERRRQVVSRRTTKEDDKIIIRVRQDDMIDHLASYNFDEQYYDTMLHLADMFAGRAEKEKALEYYDKTLAVAQSVNKTDLPFTLFAAVGEIPFRKGHLLLQFHEHEAALQLFNLAEQELRALLKTDKTHYFETIEKRLAEVVRCRAEALEHLGRFDEATQAIDEMQKILHKTLETAEISKAAQAERKKNRSFADLFQPPKQEEKKQSSRKKTQVTEEDIEEQAQARITAKHNDGVADCRRGNIELHRQHWKTALKFFLKSRHILDAPLFQSFPETQINLCTVYAGIAHAYSNLDRYDDAERWYQKAVTQFQKMINEGKLELQPSYFETLSGQAVLLAKQKKYEESVRLNEKVYHETNRLVAENLEGLDIEYLCTRDPQRLALSALLLQTQSRTIRSIENKLCILDRIDEAIEWGQRELEIFKQFLRLIPEPSRAEYDHCVAKISCAALLLLGKRYEKADALLEECERTFIKLKDEKEDKTEDKTEDAVSTMESAEFARREIEQMIFIRLYDLIGDSKHRDIQKKFHKAHYLIYQNKGRCDETAAEILESLREPVRKQQMETQNEHRLIGLFWKELERMIDTNIKRSQRELSEWIDNVSRTSPFDLPGPKSNTVIEPEEESEELDRELAQYEKDFGGEKIGNDFLYQMMDEMTGNTKASEMMRQFDRGRFQVSEPGKPFRSEETVGRNDPCPCGSGKKYKKCCMKND
ncbi:MAG: SEC-C domain-containing protein [Planctomycetaceae bacterium]|jgi:tetratricopeptide (TPR) repeat protein|nr:SEC-C domain-containing protein [Planctomycetaceae bacterium]